MVSDLREATGVFSLIEDQTTTGENYSQSGSTDSRGLIGSCRYIDYGVLYNEKTGQKARIEELADIEG